MKLKLFVIGCMFACFYVDATEIRYPSESMDAGCHSGAYPPKKRVRKENNPVRPERPEKLCALNEMKNGEKIGENGEEANDDINEKETIAAEQLVKLYYSEISKQDESSAPEREEVIRARCDFLMAVRHVLMWRQSRNRTYNRAMMLGMDMERCRREFRILENEMAELEENMEKSKQEAIDSFLRLKKAQMKSKL